MTSILNPNTETAERLIEGTVLENFVHVFGSNTSDDTERRWLPGRDSLPSLSGGSTGRGLTGPFLLVDIGAFVNAIRGPSESSDSALVGDSASDLASEDDEKSGRGSLTKVLFLGAILGVAYALNSRFRSMDEPVDETEDVAQKAANAIKQRGELAAGRIEAGSQSLAERIEEGADRTAERMDEAAETVEDVEAEVSDTAEDVEEEAADTAEDVEEEVADTTPDDEEDADDVTTDSSSGPKYET